MYKLKRRATVAAEAPPHLRVSVCPPAVESHDLEANIKGPKKHDLSIPGQLKSALFHWLNILLVFVPAGIATHYAGVNPTVVFVLNFIGIVPLAGLLSYGTEELALHSGEVIGGLLNATFGNAVELIVSILALVKREIVIVQTSLIGSILSNLLLVMGAAFLAGGFNRVEQHFNQTVAQTAASLLTVSCASLIVPTAFHMASEAGDAGITQLSRGTSVILLVVYASYLIFQLRTHQSLYSTVSKKTPKTNLFGSSSNKDTDIAPPLHANDSHVPARTDTGHSDAVQPTSTNSTTVEPTSTNSTTVENSLAASEQITAPEPEDEDEEEEQPRLELWFALALLLCSTVLVALCAESLVASIDHLVSSAGISRVFVGLILLPIVGNAAEHATAVTVAIKDKMDLAIGVAVGSSMQIALLVIPLIVIIGWIMGIEEMNLYFDGFQVMILFISVLLVNYLIQDGRSNYLEGNLLLALYLVIALASWFYPEDGALAAGIADGSGHGERR